MVEGLYQVRVQSLIESPGNTAPDTWKWVLPCSDQIEAAFSERRGVEVLFWRGSNKVMETIQDIYQRGSLALACPYPPEAIAIIITELIQNALKANYKRCHFKECGIDAGDPEAYDRGLRSFKESISNNTEALSARAVYENLYVRLRLFAGMDHSMLIRVVNNSPLFPVEEDRIREKLEASARYGNIMDFLLEHQDETEGAGLGMLVITLSLRDMGITPGAFSISQEADRRTVATLRLSWS